MVGMPSMDESRGTWNVSRRRLPVRWIVLHSTEGRLNGALEWLCNRESRVSADFVVSRAGVIFKLTPDVGSWYTWHAGRSLFHGLANINRVSVGIELEHCAGESWPDWQVDSAARLCGWLATQFGLDLRDNPIQSHRAVAWPFGRKSDPTGFPWARFGARVRSLLGGGG